MAKWWAVAAAVVLSACDPGDPSWGTPKPDAGGTLPDAGTPVDPGLQCPDTFGGSVGQQVDFRGLWTAPNDASKVPPGGTKVALNVVSDRVGLAECRPGQGPLPGAYLDSSERLLSGTLYAGQSFEHTGGVLYRRAPGVAPVKVADVVPASPTGRLKMVVASDDLYLTTNVGVKAIDTVMGVPRTPGAPVPLDFYGYSFFTDTPFLPVGNAVNYRIVYFRQDTEGRPILGAPSSLIKVANTSNELRSVQLRIPLPPEVRVGDRVQVYRSQQVPAANNPGDMLYQVAEVPLTPSPIGGGELMLTDNTPDALLGSILYTSASQQGITRANNPAPHAVSAEFYKEALFLGNLTYGHRVQLRILGTPQTTVTMMINEDTSLVLNPNTDPDMTVSQKVEQQARDIVTAINDGTGSFPARALRAYYASGDTDPPGIIVFERLDFSDTPINISVDQGGELFSPALNVPLVSTQERQPHGIAISKQGLPYAFPSNSSYHLLLGRSDYPILGLMKNRDSLFAFKQDGVWRIYPGPRDEWAVQQMSTDVALQFPDSLAMVDNTVIGFFNRGIMGVSESGLEEYDEPIKNITDAIRSINLPYAQSQPNVFAVADPTRLRYYLWYPEESGETVSTHAHLYNARTDTWTERDDAATGGFTGPDGLIYLGRADTAGVTEERNSGTVQDYQGPDGLPLKVQLDWTLYNGNPGGASRFNEVRLLTEKPTLGPYRADFTTDTGYQQGADCRAEGYNSVRLPVPFMCVRTTALGVSVKRDVLQEYLVVLGLKDVTRGYDGKPGK